MPQMMNRVLWLVLLSLVCVNTQRTLVGVHFDVEPHTLPGWSTDRVSVATQFVALVTKLRQALGASSLCLTMDVPIAFRSAPGTSGSTFATTPLLQSVMDAADRVTVMDYRDQALGQKGFGGIVSLGQPFVDYGNQIGKPVVLGVETINIAPEYITFFEEGGQVMDSELQITNTYFHGNRSFDFFAVHEVRTYMTIKNPSTTKPSLPRDVWLWNWEDYVNNATARTQFFAWAVSQNVRTIYLEAQEIVQDYTDKTNTRTFLDVAKSNRICVEFLFGLKTWALTENHAKAVALVNLTLSFVNTLGPDYTSGPAACGCGFSQNSPDAVVGGTPTPPPSNPTVSIAERIRGWIGLCVVCALAVLLFV